MEFFLGTLWLPIIMFISGNIAFYKVKRRYAKGDFTCKTTIMWYGAKVTECIVNVDGR